MSFVQHGGTSPEKGEEVLIAFEEGDAERPYVVGSAWNGVHQPPAAGFHQASEQNGTEFAANNIKRLVTKSGHRITLVDTPGTETISIATPRSTQLMLTEHHADTGRPAIVLSSKGDLLLSAPNGRIHSQSKFHSRDVGLQLPPKSPLTGMTCTQKMKAALEHAPWGAGVMNALGGAKGVATFVAAAVVIQFVPIAGEVEDALLIAGTLLAGGNVVEGFNQLKQFHDFCCNQAKTEADLQRAGKMAADAVGTIGVNGVLAALPLITKGGRAAKLGDEAEGQGGLTLRHYPVETKPNEAYLWSGRSPNEDGTFSGGAERTAEIAEKNGGTTLEQLAAKRGIEMPDFNQNDPEV